MTEIYRIDRSREPESPRFVDKAQKIYSDLQAGITHAPPCDCPACLFNQYRKYPRGAGHPFSKEIFFLDWLSFEIKFSMLKITTAYVGEKWEEKKYYNWRELFHVRGSIAEIIKFLAKYKNRFPTITNINPGRIKLSLWRFRKSGVSSALEKEIILNGIKANPVDPKINKTWGALSFAQKVADFIKSRPGRKASYREILRHFSNKRKSDIDNVLWPLRGNYQMQIVKQGASMVLIYAPPSIEQVKAHRQRIIQEIIDDENKLFGDEEN